MRRLTLSGYIQAMIELLRISDCDDFAHIFLKPEVVVVLEVFLLAVNLLVNPFVVIILWRMFVSSFFYDSAYNSN